MLFSEPFRQKRIANGTRKRNVHNTAVMHMPDFRISEAELTGGKAMRMDRDLRPRRDGIFELLQLLHEFDPCPFDARARSLGSCPHVVSMGVRFTRSAGIGRIEIRGGGIWRMRDGLPAEKGSTTKAMAHKWNANARAAHCIVGAWLVVMEA